MASFRVALVAILALAPCVRAAHGSQSAGVASREKSLEAAWSLDSNSKVSPVQRVVALLGKMKAELEEEASSESGMYDKMVCWCETNEKEKTKAIADADAKDIELGGEVESRGARFGELSATIASLKAQVASDKAMLEQATAIREREAGEFRDEEKDLVQYVTNLKNAIAALSKHQLLQTDGKGSLLQVGSLDGQLVSGLRVLLRDAALKYELLLAERGSAPKRRVASLLSTAVGKASADSEILLSALDVHGSPVTDALPPTFAARIVERAAAAPRKGSRGAFLQAGDAQPLYESRSSARSAGIFGVLTQMMEEFESQLSQEQKDEMKGASDYAALKGAKEDQIEAGEKKLDNLEAEDAANQKALADAREDLTLLREQRSKDVEFLQNLKITCGNIDTQWDRRSKTRAAELTAVAETIAILTEDDNREHLAKTVSFLQERSVSQAEAELAMRRSSAVGALRKAAASPDFEADDLLSAWRGRRSAGLAGASNGPRSQLSTLAVSVQLDTFTKVREMMDKMVASLKEEQEEEVKFKAYCGKELDTTEKETYAKSQTKKDLETQIDQLKTLLENLAKETAEAQAQIAETQTAIKKASENREGENAEFQQVVSDQRATQAILAKALQRLADYYAKGMGKQVGVLAQQEPPVKFNAYKDNKNSKPVTGLLEQIIEDSKALEKEATEGETAAQAAYETFVKDSNGLVAGLDASIAQKSKASAAAKLEKAQAETDLGSTVGELESLAAYDADLHGQCDFVLKNFGVRQKARLQEIEAIQAAKGILAGAGKA